MKEFEKYLKEKEIKALNVAIKYGDECEVGHWNKVAKARKKRREG